MILVTGESAICLVVYSDKHVEIFEWKCCDKISYLRNLRAREQLTSSSGKASGNNISGIAVPDSWVLIMKCILKRKSKVFWENFFCIWMKNFSSAPLKFIHRFLPNSPRILFLLMLMNTLWLWESEFLSTLPSLHDFSNGEKQVLYLTAFEMGKRVITEPVCLFFYFSKT